MNGRDSPCRETKKNKEEPPRKREQRDENRLKGRRGTQNKVREEEP